MPWFPHMTDDIIHSGLRRVLQRVHFLGGGLVQQNLQVPRHHRLQEARRENQRAAQSDSSNPTLGRLLGHAAGSHGNTSTTRPQRSGGKGKRRVCRGGRPLRASASRCSSASPASPTPPAPGASTRSRPIPGGRRAASRSTTPARRDTPTAQTRPARPRPVVRSRPALQGVRACAAGAESAEREREKEREREREERERERER